MLWMIERFEGLALPLGKTQLAVIVVTLSALVFVVYSLLMLSRISRRTEEGVAGLEGLMGEIRDEIQGFRFASKQMSALVDRSNIALAGLEHKLKEFQASMHGGLPVSPELIQFVSDGVGVLQSVSEMDAEKLPSWQSEQRVELDRLLAQKACLEKELEALRSKHRSVAESESLTTRLRSLNQQLLVDLRDMRRRQLETEAKCESMAEALAHANARLAVQSRADRGRVGNEALAADNTVPGERLSALEAALRQSQAKLQECEEALSRSLREKSMIEDRFLQDDATR